MKKIILILAAMLTFAACTKEGDVIYQTDPADAPSTTPLVTVIYDPNAVGDGNYNDLIYQSVEQAAKEHGLRTMHLSPSKEHGLRTMHLSPSSRTEGLAYLETLFQQMSAAQDTVRRLFIVAAASYDDYLRRNNRRLEANPYTDLLYLETSEPLDGKGSTLCLPYYGAMYEAGAIAQSLASEVLLVAANPKVESVGGAVDGFTDGFNADYIQYPERLGISKTLVTEYLSDDVAGGFTVADTTAIHVMYDRQWTGYFKMLVPVCGGAARTFQYLNDMMGGYSIVGINLQDARARLRRCCPHLPVSERHDGRLRPGRCHRGHQLNPELALLRQAHRPRRGTLHLAVALARGHAQAPVARPGRRIHRRGSHARQQFSVQHN